MVHPSPAPRRAARYGLAAIARDYALVMPGFFLSLFAFVVLIPLFALSLGTLVVWVGALLLPAVLTAASGFAELSRSRLRRWGMSMPRLRYAPRTPGLSGWVKRVSDPRRWLDLAFEGVVALPLHAITFSVATAWTAGAVAGVTYWIWGVFLPRDDLSLPGLILEALSDGAASDALTRSYALDAGFQFVAGLVLLVTLPFVMRGLAWLDAVTTAAALGSVRDPGSAARNGATSSASPQHRSAAALSADGWAWVSAVFAAVATLAVSWPVLSTLYGVHPFPAMLVALGQALALILVVRLPGLGILVQTVAVGATAFVTAEPSGWPWPWPVTALIAQSLLVLLVAIRKPWPWALSAWLAPQLGVLAVALPLSNGTAPAMSGGAGNMLIVSASVTLGIAAVGAALRALAKSRGALRDERRANESLNAQRRELDERTRIAQELHDVVAHSMSVISVQATTAEYRLPGLEPDVRDEFASIAQSSRQALSEMRSLLVLLRASDDDREAALAPQPTLADIPALVEATRRSGAAISLDCPDPREDDGGAGGTGGASGAAIPPSVGLTVYRIVQEALSNAVRHAPGSSIAVEVRIVEQQVVVDVSNGPADAASGREPAPGAGLGLSGVRERAMALGGAVEAGPDAAGGFRVRASIPLA